MIVAILSRTPGAGATERLAAEAEARRHTVQVIDVLAATVGVGTGVPPLIVAGRAAPEADVVIPRIGETITGVGTAVLRRAESRGAAALNSADAIDRTRDKLRQLQTIASAGVPVPDTAFVFRREDMPAAIAAVGGDATTPVVIKSRGGSRGVGVVLAESAAAALGVLEALQDAGRPAMVQRFAAECRGRDLRVLVVGDRVVAAMRRTAAGDEFRGNLDRGGRGEPADVDDVVGEMALSATRALGLEVAGVDLLETAHGPWVIEVNVAPGLTGIERVTGANVAGAMIDRAVELAAAARGAGPRSADGPSRVVDVTVGERSVFAGARLDASGVAARGVTVLSLRRGAQRLAAPAMDLQIQPGDVLTCRGPDDALRAVGRAAGGAEPTDVGPMRTAPDAP